MIPSGKHTARHSKWLTSLALTIALVIAAVAGAFGIPVGLHW
jgi:hypothetical protein